MKNNGLIKQNRNFLDDFFNDDFGLLTRDFFAPMKSMRSMVRTNESETESEFLLEFSLPGMGKEDINIEIDGDYLSVSSKKEEKDEKHWSYQSFSKTYYLGENVDMDNIKSSMKDGILSINLPKKEIEKPKKKVIEIQ